MMEYLHMCQNDMYIGENSSTSPLSSTKSSLAGETSGVRSLDVW